MVKSINNMEMVNLYSCCRCFVTPSPPYNSVKAL